MKVITIAGNLGKDCEVQSNQRGEFITFSVAVTEGSKENKKTIWFGCSSYKVNLAQYLKKGTKVVVTGTLIIEEKGNRTFHDVRASHIQLMNDRKATTQDQSEDTSENSENSDNTNQDFDDEIPF